MMYNLKIRPNSEIKIYFLKQARFPFGNCNSFLTIVNSLYNK